MKQEHNPIERLAFHLIPSRDIALQIATDGLRCEQLSFSIDNYLGKFIKNSKKKQTKFEFINFDFIFKRQS